MPHLSTNIDIPICIYIHIHTPTCEIDVSPIAENLAPPPNRGTPASESLEEPAHMCFYGGESPLVRI